MEADQGADTSAPMDAEAQDQKKARTEEEQAAEDQNEAQAGAQAGADQYQWMQRQWQNQGQHQHTPAWGNPDPNQWHDPGYQGQWMYNPGWGNEMTYLKGWIYVQGYFDWGVALSWHVQRNRYTDPGGLFWVCVL